MKQDWINLLAGLALISLSVSCDQPSSPAPGSTPQPLASDKRLAPAQPGPWMAEGQRISAQAFQVLSSNLLQALQAGPASNALRFCSVQAAPLALSVAQTHDVRLQRVSHKARNPANRASPDERALLLQFQKTIASGHSPGPVLRTADTGAVVYYAPILLKDPVCLNCHGQPGAEIQPETLAVIRELYPEDQATGFALGELRGLWRIEFLKSSTPPRE